MHDGGGKERQIAQSRHAGTEMGVCCWATGFSNINSNNQGKLLCDNQPVFRSVSLSRCRLVPLVQGLFPGSSEKEKLTPPSARLTPPALYEAPRLADAFASFSYLQDYVQHTARSGEPLCVHDLHLLCDKDAGCVFPGSPSEKTPFCFFFCFAFCSLSHSSCQLLRLISVSHLLCTPPPPPPPPRLTHPHTLDFFFFIFYFHLNLTFQASYSMTPCLFASL